MKSFWETKHKASEFVVEKGCMRIGKVFLKSVRIPAMSKKILESISHEFKIRKDYQRQGQFYFEPATDLSLFIGLAQNVEIQKNWDRLFNRHIRHKSGKVQYSYYEYRQLDSILSPIKEKLNLNNNYYKNYKGGEWSLCVPSTDVIISDGIIEVSFSNADFLGLRRREDGLEDEWYPNWSEFCVFRRKPPTHSGHTTQFFRA